MHPGTYREVVDIPADKAELTLRGATRDPRDVVIVYDNANGTQKPDGSGTYGTAGSATFSSAAPGLTVRDLTLANDWLRADHPEITGTQAVAAYTYGDRTHFENVRLLAHQDTLFVETTALDAFDRQYFHRCYIEGDVDFVFGRATAVFEDCHFRTLQRDVDFTPKGMVFAPSTARANPHGILAAPLPDQLRRRGRGVQAGAALGADVRDDRLAVPRRAGQPDRRGNRRGDAVRQHAGDVSLADHAVPGVPQHGSGRRDHRAGEPAPTRRRERGVAHQVGLPRRLATPCVGP